VELDVVQSTFCECSRQFKYGSSIKNVQVDSLTIIVAMAMVIT